jgi:hypothetical protein
MHAPVECLALRASCDVRDVCVTCA